MILQIEREWHKEPGWFATLDHRQQIDLIAMHRVEHTPKKDLVKKVDKRSLIKKRIEEKY